MFRTYIRIFLAFTGLVVLVFLYTKMPHIGPPNRRHPVSVNNITHIADWMTFDYINNLFNLPPELLQTSLGITSPKYPHITIRQYAKKNNKDIPEVIIDIKQVVTTYFEQQPKN